jgi:putative acetyltransferase
MIRKFENEDAAAVMEVWRQSSKIAHSFLKPEFVVQAQRDLQNIYLAVTETWIYEVHGNIAGFISMLNNEIGGLFVLPQFQGKGIGAALVNFVVSKFSELEVEVFDRNAIGRGFYEKFGFIPIYSYLHEESGEVVRRLTLLRINRGQAIL